MTLSAFRDLADRMMQPLVTGAVRVGLTPNLVSVVAILVAGAAGGAFALAGDRPVLYLLGAVLVVLNGILDLLDGGLARELGVESLSGDMFDHVLDRYADILIVGGLATGIENYLLGFVAVTGVLMTSYLGTQAEAVGIERVYGGLLGRADRLALVTAVTLLAPFVEMTVFDVGLVGLLLIVFAVVGHLTAAQRFYYSMQELS
ncbi:archaetidylinositol phosphate synthase [Halovenus aranensis]|jgi:archaetidylinositol phosphate synthase|uniref:Archaetidylinositol phosphate synthase n=1 Tax=Halovenus aranensis TaxID=890420 RepID=A0A1G8TU76_9EURY|nr:CDP-alcohol phosphatidyltransferase family protein [Halovenus aranensis]SDJ45039.1 archaetidylinositol phosphate synthase [Halovenus aranensis]